MEGVMADNASAGPPGAAHLVHRDDDVAVAITPIPAGAAVEAGGVAVCAGGDIPRGHKIALRTVRAGEPVRKYGFPIGLATADIAPGDHVHSHNLKTALGGPEAYIFAPTQPVMLEAPRKSFQGYVRSSGRVGTRNEIWLLPTVGCVNRTAERLARRADDLFKGRVDGVHAFTHQFGCSQLGDDLDRTRKLLAALAGHPNAGG